MVALHPASLIADTSPMLHWSTHAMRVFSMLELLKLRFDEFLRVNAMLYCGMTVVFWCFTAVCWCFIVASVIKKTPKVRLVK